MLDAIQKPFTSIATWVVLARYPCHTKAFQMVDGTFVALWSIVFEKEQFAMQCRNIVDKFTYVYLPGYCDSGQWYIVAMLLLLYASF